MGACKALPLERQFLYKNKRILVEVELPEESDKIAQQYFVDILKKIYINKMEMVGDCEGEN